MKLIAFAIFNAIVSYWIWRLFLPYPWADMLALLGGSVVLTFGYILKRRAHRGYNREKSLLPRNRDTNAPTERETRNLTPSELSSNDAQAEVEAYRYFFDAEDFPRTPEEWKPLEDFVKKHPASLREWYIEEEGMEPESLKPEFLISWLHDLAELA